MDAMIAQWRALSRRSCRESDARGMSERGERVLRANRSERIGWGGVWAVRMDSGIAILSDEMGGCSRHESIYLSETEIHIFIRNG
jgi:hypothetical protein